MPNFNMTLNKHTMPAQSPSERAKNFREVALGYDENTAVEEARRCVRCKTRPCVSGCPVGIDIPAFVGLVAEGKFEEAYEVIRAASSLPAVCGRVCAQETQCEGKCTRGIKGEPVAIGRLERFVADRHMQNASASAAAPAGGGRKVAVVGSGPAGLACAGDLAKLGYDVTAFEALHLAGGVLMYGIPEFRLPKEIVRREIAGLEALGVKFVMNAVISQAFLLEELFTEEGFEAVFLGTGAGLPRFMNIPGENAKGVFSANEFLTRINLMKAYEPDAETPVFRAARTVVVGGGNVAMDAARCARRLGSEVTVVYRRSEAELPARREEVLHAKEEGIGFAFLTNPVEIVCDGEDNVVGVRCVGMTLGEADESGRRRPIALEGSERVIPAACVIMALGTSPNPLIARSSVGLATGPRGEILTDAEGRTSLPGVFAGGDAVTGAATVILAMGAGKTAARSIDAYLKEKPSRN